MASNKDAPGDVLAMKEDLLRDEWFRLVEKDDRTSPEEYPEMCFITREEVGEIIDAAIDRLDVKAEAKSQEPGVVVKPLRWVRSSVFGSYKWRGMSQDFGEVGCFTDVAYSDAQIDEKKAAIQADYEQRIRSALIHPTTKPDAPAVSVDAIKDLVRSFHRNSCYPEAGTGELNAVVNAIAALIAGER